MKITIIDDNITLSKSIKKFFEKQWHKIDLYHSRQAFMDAPHNNCDAYILDVDLKDGNGLDVARYLRGERNDESPILMISGYEELKTKLEWFNIWVDDYIVKPFSPLELEARVKSVMWRVWWNSIVNNDISYKNLSFNKQNRQLTQDGNHVELSKKEKQIIELFLEKQWVFVSKDMLINKVWWNKCDLDHIQNTINVSICKVRKKLWDNFKLETINWEWYILEK